MQTPWQAPAILTQVFPEKQKIPLNWIEHQLSSATMLIDFAVSPDGKRLLMEWQVALNKREAQESKLGSLVRQLELHDLALRQRERIWSKGTLKHVWHVLQFSPDGRRAVVKGHGFEIWNVENGTVHRAIDLATRIGPGHVKTHQVVAAAFSADGRLLYTAAEEGRFDVVDVESGSILRTWYEPKATAKALAVSPDGSILATAGEDELLRLWDPASGKELARWLPHPSGATALAFHPDGQVLASGGDDGTLKLWELPFIRKELAAIGLDW
jgi:WD40 repeat protein